MMKPRYWLLLLGLFSMGWHLRAIVQDDRFRWTDTIVEQVLRIRVGPQPRTPFQQWPHLGRKGIIAPLLAQPFIALIGDLPLAIRLMTTLLHLLLMFQVYVLARRLWGRANAGLWAALIWVTTPLAFGLFRLTHHDTLAAVCVTGAVQLMLTLSLEHRGSAIRLGAVLGLGLLSKISFGFYMVWPGIVFFARRVRNKTAMANGLLMVSIAGVMATAWFLLNRKDIILSLLGAGRAGQMQATAWEKLCFYQQLLGFGPLVIMALISCGVLCFSRRISRWDILLVSTFAPMLLSVLFFLPTFSRFLLPALPLMAVLLGTALALLQESTARWSLHDRKNRVIGDSSAAPLPATDHKNDEQARDGTAAFSAGLPPRGHRGSKSTRWPEQRLAGRVVMGLPAVAMLLSFVWLNLMGHAAGETRELYEGMIAPDPGPYRAFARALETLAPYGPKVLVVFDSPQARAATIAERDLWVYRGWKLQLLQVLDAIIMARKERKTISVVLIRAFPRRAIVPDLNRRGGPPLTPQERYMLEPEAGAYWLAHQGGRSKLATFRDPDGLEYWVYRVYPD